MRKFAVSAVLATALLAVLAPGALAQSAAIDGTPLKIYADGLGRLQIVDKDLGQAPEVGMFLWGRIMERHLFGAPLGDG